MKITYQPICRACGSDKNLVTIKWAEGDYHLCKRCESIANNPIKPKNGGK